MGGSGGQLIEQNERHRERLHVGRLTNRKEAFPRFRGEVAVISNQAGPRSSEPIHHVINSRSSIIKRTRYRTSQIRARRSLTYRGVLDRYCE